MVPLIQVATAEIGSGMDSLDVEAMGLEGIMGMA
jgi:hypothetical protein